MRLNLEVDVDIDVFFLTRLSDSRPLPSGFESAVTARAFASERGVELFRALLARADLSEGTRSLVVASTSRAAKLAWLSSPETASSSVLSCFEMFDEGFWLELLACNPSPSVFMALSEHPSKRVLSAVVNSSDAPLPALMRVAERFHQGDRSALSALEMMPLRLLLSDPSLLELIEDSQLERSTLRRLAGVSLPLTLQERLVEGLLALEEELWVFSPAELSSVLSDAAVVFDVEGLPPRLHRRAACLVESVVHTSFPAGARFLEEWVGFASSASDAELVSALAARDAFLARVESSADEGFLMDAAREAVCTLGVLRAGEFSGLGFPMPRVLRSLLRNERLPLAVFSLLCPALDARLLERALSVWLPSAVTPAQCEFLVAAANSDPLPLPGSGAEWLLDSVSTPGVLLRFPWSLASHSPSVFSLLEEGFQGCPGAWDVFAVLSVGFEGTFEEMVGVCCSLS